MDYENNDFKVSKDDFDFNGKNNEHGKLDSKWPKFSEDDGDDNWMKHKGTWGNEDEEDFDFHAKQNMHGKFDSNWSDFSEDDGNYD